MIRHLAGEPWWSRNCHRWWRVWIGPLRCNLTLKHFYINSALNLKLGSDFIRVAVAHTLCFRVSANQRWSKGKKKTSPASFPLPFRLASRGVMALWCQTVMSSVQGNTINTMATMSRLFGISSVRPESCLYLRGTWHKMWCTIINFNRRFHPKRLTILHTATGSNLRLSFLLKDTSTRDSSGSNHRSSQWKTDQRTTDQESPTITRTGELRNDQQANEISVYWKSNVIVIVISLISYPITVIILYILFLFLVYSVNNIFVINFVWVFISGNIF